MTRDQNYDHSSLPVQLGSRTDYRGERTPRNLMNEPQLVLLTGHGTAVDTVAISPDGLTFASGGRDGLVLLWEVATGALRRQLAGHQSAVTAMAFSPDSAMLATSDWYGVRLWDAGTGKWLGTIPGLMGPLAFTASGSGLVARNSAEWPLEEALVLLDPESAEIHRSVGLVGEKLEDSAVSLNGGYAAAERDVEDRSELVAWDLRTGTEIVRYLVEKDFPGEVRSRRTGEMVPVRFSSEVDHLAVSSCGRWLAVAGSYAVWLCDLHTGQRTHMLALGNCFSRSLAFSADGEFLASGDADGVLRIWDSASGELRRTVRAHTS